MEINLKMLGQNIRYLRQGKNLSLADLASKSGVSKTYISDLENGLGGRPNVQYLYKIALALETTIDTLIDLSLKPAQRRAIPAASQEPLPPGLEEFSKKERLEPQQIEMLAGLNFRGNRPKDADAWKLIYDTIKMASRS
jgi:transcriptional regulator with XRE-family HTH domain